MDIDSGGTLCDPCTWREACSVLSRVRESRGDSVSGCWDGPFGSKKKERPGKMETDGHSKISRGAFGTFGDTVLPGILLRG